MQLEISPHKVRMSPQGNYPDSLTLNGEGFAPYANIRILVNGNIVFSFQAENAGQFIVQMKASALVEGSNDVQAVDDQGNETNIVYVSVVEGKD